MPLHPLAGPLRQLVSIGHPKCCAACKCSCGRIFRPYVFPIQQRRAYEPRPNINPYASSRIWKQYKKEREEFEATRYYKGLLKARRFGMIKTSAENALEFVNGFSELYEARGRRKGVGVDVRAFDELFRRCDISRADCEMCARFLLLDHTKPEYAILGKNLMYTLSHWGWGGATIHIIQQTLLRARSRPNVLRSSELVDVRKHLTHMAATGDKYVENESFVPKVMEGKVEYALGNVDTAIDWWTKSIQPAVALSEDKRKEMSLEMNADPYAESLFTPWVELTHAFLQKKDFEKAKWAIDIGCQQDDPTSHYSAAVLEKKVSERGEHVTTSSWLYHMTKAGGAGYVKAAHALGNWYASSGWKYIEDEPSDRIKPTPFDSYPPDETSEMGLSSFWNQLGIATGLRSPPEQEPKDRLFLTATFPSTPYGRFKMAMQWLEVSMGVMYAPSYLLAARLLLEPTLWPLAAAPKEALELSETRYTYASRSDYEAGIRIERPPEENDNEPQEIPNPGYDPDRAKDLIREVLYAWQASATARKFFEVKAKSRSRGKEMNERSMEDLMDEDELPASWSTNLRKWFRFPEAREMYMNDETGLLYDDELQIDLLAAARQICDEQEWDIYDEEGGLLYKHSKR